MLVEPKKYKVGSGERPKVLLIGNGVNRAYDGASWDKMLDDIKDKEKFPKEAKNYILPMPLKATLLSGRDLRTKLKRSTCGIAKEKENHWDDFSTVNDKQREAIRKFIDIGFDYILTTNYSYELECALLGKNTISKNELKDKMVYCEGKAPQTKFLLSTFNRFKSDTKEYDIWHIHGEARRPESMILGHDYYGRLLCRYIERTGGYKNTLFDELDNGKEVTMGSWIDALFVGDVFVVGLGLDFSEMDLWWLLEYRKGIADRCPYIGRVYYYEPVEEKSLHCIYDTEIKCKQSNKFVPANDCKLQLLESYGVEIRNLDTEISKKEDYRDFYNKVVEDIQKLL